MSIIKQLLCTWEKHSGMGRHILIMINVRSFTGQQQNLPYLRGIALRSTTSAIPRTDDDWQSRCQIWSLYHDKVILACQRKWACQESYFFALEAQLRGCSGYVIKVAQQPLGHANLMRWIKANWKCMSPMPLWSSGSVLGNEVDDLAIATCFLPHILQCEDGFI